MGRSFIESIWEPRLYTYNNGPRDVDDDDVMLMMMWEHLADDIHTPDYYHNIHTVFTCTRAKIMTNINAGESRNTKYVCTVMV